MITKNNYAQEIGKYDVDAFPAALKKVYDFIKRETKDYSDWKIYDASEPIKKMIDMYFEKLSQIRTKDDSKFIKEHIMVVRPGAITDEPKVKYKNGTIVWIEDNGEVVEAEVRGDVYEGEEEMKVSYTPAGQRVGKLLYVKTKSVYTKAPEKKATFRLPEILEKLMPKYQQAGQQALSAEGKEEMKPVLERIARDLSELPKLYSQDGLGKKAIVHAHYFTGASDWWITEWDGEDSMFGYVVLNGDVEMSEFGYISASEITSIRQVELDFYWKKVTLEEALYKSYPKYFPNPQEAKSEEVDVEEVVESESSLKPKYSVGDYVKWKAGDLKPFTWHGIVRFVLPLENEFAYRIDAYGKTDDGVLYTESNNTEVYEAQLSPSNKKNVDELKQEHFAQRSQHAKPESKKTGSEQPVKSKEVKQKGQNLADFEVGDRVINIYDKQEYEIIKMGGRGDIATIENVKTGAKQQYNIHNNAHFVRAKKEVSKIAVAGRALINKFNKLVAKMSGHGETIIADTIEKLEYALSLSRDAADKQLMEQMTDFERNWIGELFGEKNYKQIDAACAEFWNTAEKKRPNFRDDHWYDSLYETAQTDPVKAKEQWSKLSKLERSNFKARIEAGDAAGEGNYKGFLYLISDKNIRDFKKKNKKSKVDIASNKIYAVLTHFDMDGKVDAPVIVSKFRYALEEAYENKTGKELDNEIINIVAGFHKNKLRELKDMPEVFNPIGEALQQFWKEINKKAPSVPSAPAKVKADKKKRPVSLLKKYMFDEKHPLMVLEQGSPQWNKAYDEFAAEVKIHPSGKEGYWEPVKKAKSGKYANAEPIEKELESVRFIRRYIGLNNRMKSKDQISSFIDSLQRAISERRISKGDKYAKEIMYIQRELVRLHANMKRPEVIQLTDKEMKDLGSIAFSQVPMLSIRFLKRYISLDGKLHVKEKAKKLYSDIENAIHSGKITEADKYYKPLETAHKKLFAYIEGRTKTLEVWDAELNGFRDFFQSAQNTARSAYSKVAPVVKKAGQTIKTGIEKAKPHVKKAVDATREKIKSLRESKKSESNNRKHTGIKFRIARPFGTKHTEIQSVMFRTDLWNEKTASAWLRDHGMHDDKHEVTGNYHYYRQHAVSKYDEDSFKTISAGSAAGLGLLPFIAKAVTAAVISNGVSKAMNKNSESLSGSPVVEDSIFSNLSDVKSRTGTFKLKGDIGKWLGNLERNKLAMTIEGDKGAGKTQLAFQIADAFADESMSVGFFELESPKDSDPISRNRDMYIKHVNASKIFIADEAPEGIQTIRKYGNHFDVIIIDTFTKLNVDSIEFDHLRNDFPNTIWIVLFQMAANKIIRGGTEPLFDAGINIEVKKVDNTFMNNYAVCSKNRYGQTGIRYNIAFRAIVD